MNNFFPEVKRRFGFGAMRMLKTEDGAVDRALFCKLVDRFLEAGFNYFDTAHVYLGGDSEKALKDCLTSRYPRDAYILTNKLTNNCFEKEEDIRPLFESQLEACGVEYFDFYLMHAMNRERLDKYEAANAFGIAKELKAEGKIRHIGFSFHDKAVVLDEILTKHPEVEVVQLQFNYLDYDSVTVESKKCYDVCVKHGKPVIVMEPVKGSRLAELTPDTVCILNDLKGGSPASYAFRFVADHPQVFMILSGMNTMEQLEDNIATMTEPKPLSETEKAAVAKVVEVINGKGMVSCTACKYCVDGCPMSINIPSFISIYNAFLTFNDKESKHKYEVTLGRSGDPASCIGCGQCAEICPQKLPIPELMGKIAEALGK